MVNGQRISRSFDTVEQAQAWAVSIRQGEATIEGAKCLADAVELVLHEAKAARVRPATLGFYRQQGDVILNHIDGGTPLGAVTTSILREFVAERNSRVGAGTVAKNMAFLRRVFRRAVGEGWLAADPTARLAPLQAQIGKRHRPERFPALSAAQVDRVLAQIRGSHYPAAERDADAISVFWATGLRRREMADVRVKHVEPWTGRIKVDPKTQGDIVFAEGPAREALGRLCRGRDPEDRLIGTANAISKIFRRWQKRLEIPALKAHALRHGAATHLVREGCPLLAVQNFMRHATPVMTARYYHEDEQAQRGTAAVLHRRGGQQDRLAGGAENAGG